MKGEMDFSDKWFRKRFRDEFSRHSCPVPGEDSVTHYERVVRYLKEHGVTLSSSGKMAYDRNLNGNNCTNMYFYDRTAFVVYAKQKHPDIFKKGSPPLKRAKPVHKGRVTTPTKKPVAVGWDDFDWSR